MADGSITIETSLDNSGIVQNMNQLQQTLQRAGTEMGNQFQQIENAAQNNMRAAAQSISNLGNTMQQTAESAGVQLSNSLQSAAQQAAQSMTEIDNSTNNMTTHVTQSSETLSQNIGNSFEELGNSINDNINEPLEQLGDTLGGIGEDIGEPLDGLEPPLEEVNTGLIHIVDGIEEIEQISSEAFGGSINDIQNMDTELQQAEKSTERVKETFSKLGSHIVDAMKKAAAAATAAFTAAMGAAVKVGMDFESGMSQVAATMGITTSEIASGSQEFEALSQAAKNAGATTKFSATQASEALNYLALAGYDAQKSIDALPKVLNLAAAGGIDLGYASDMVTDSMSALGLETNQLESFVDQLAKASQKSNTSIAQLGEAILTVGGTAKDLAGGTVELNTALGILADNGVKGAKLLVA